MQTTAIIKMINEALLHKNGRRRFAEIIFNYLKVQKAFSTAK